MSHQLKSDEARDLNVVEDLDKKSWKLTLCSDGSWDLKTLGADPAWQVLPVIPLKGFSKIRHNLRGHFV